MVLQAFVDDSGDIDAPGNPVSVLAGFVADSAKWADFSDEWAAALKRVPSIDYFKMAEAMSLSGQFAKRLGWTDAKRDLKVLSLVRIIRKWVPRRIACSISNRDFAQHVRTLPVRNRDSKMDKPYSIMSQFLMMDLAVFHWFNGIHKPCDFIFDEHGKIGEEAMSAWTSLKALATQRAVKGEMDHSIYLGSQPIFRDEKAFLPLQAADLYAWQIRRYFADNRTLIMPTRPLLAELNSIPGTHRHLGAQELSGLRTYLQDRAAKFEAANPNVPLHGYEGSKAEQKRRRVKAKEIKRASRRRTSGKSAS